MSVLMCRGVSVSFDGVQALADVDLAIETGASLALVGRSGSGKTTLLHVLAGLVAPTRGEVERNGRTSLVFQGATLLEHLAVVENASFVAAEGVDVEELLTLVGLASKLDHLPSELSGGEAQRAAIARALAQRPDVLLCDEPTGHLDSDTAGRVLELIGRLRQELGFALVVATHDPGVAATCDESVELHDGRIGAALHT